MMAAAAATTVLLVAILARVTFNSLLAQYWPFGNGSTYTTANATRNTLATTAGAVAAAGPVTIVRIKDGANMRKLPRQHDSSQNVLHTRLRNFCSNCPVNIDQRGCVNKHGRIRRNNLAMLLVTTLTLVFLDSAHADTMVRIKVSNDAMIKVVSYGHPVMFNLRSCWHLHARLLSTHTPFNFDPWYTGRLQSLEFNWFYRRNVLQW